jgi:signal transduction histidine kinase
LRYDLLKKGEAVISEREIKKKNGDIVTIQSNSKQMPDGTFVTFIRDISKLRKEQRVGENNARLESLGVLAAGIAHNFNNLMTGIFNYTSIASYHSKELYTKEMLNKVQLLIDKVRSLTARLITFSAGGYIEKSYCNVENIVNEIIKNIENPKYTVENIVNTSSISEIDEAQFRLAVEGILNNAVQSMPDGGKLTVSSQKIKLDDSNSYSLKGGEYIKLSVKDEGIGISSESLSKIYDPFYSTKDGHDGIGLSIAYSVIKKLDGTINCKSTPGVGTVFDILLPVVN